ncbi:tRNA dihydrouridine synthase DusB [Zhengella mangrovi]|uniref:tRNA-dihydrouridine synthase n=1 Tax=Zhengella mangrovi TaxID=1982044 RepID=A0A2G1QJW6_9HYPH|nr:tRNA dihydrouridine synthase DusB [Zhengella mangrovi]PHP65827.1 tRNA dihydrouridine synthase DusB [Zhengella mangrovi]
MPNLAALAQPLTIGSVAVPNRVFLAPMSGVTDQPFRLRAHRAGAGLTISEMVASGELAKGRAESVRRIRLAGVPVQSVQLAGREAEAMAEGARIAEEGGADIIDINMGCPAKKVTGGYCGSALMRDPDHALSLVSAVVAAVSVPVTLKMRLGWDDDSRNAPLIARMAQDAGVAMITVHGRTRQQFYKGRADWRAIRAVREAVSVPLVANGDVECAEDAAEILEQSGADAVMIGRGHYGQPWLAGTIAARAMSPSAARAAPASRRDLAAYVVEHYRDMLDLYGEQSGLRQARKHLGWYLDRHAAFCPAQTRAAIMTGTDPEAVIAALELALTEDAFFTKRSAA